MQRSLKRQIQIRIIEQQTDAEDEHRKAVSVLSNVNSMLSLKGFSDKHRSLVVDWIRELIDTRLSARMQTKHQMQQSAGLAVAISQLRGCN